MHKRHITNNRIDDIAKLFLKWVGGKGQLLQQLREQLPRDFYDEVFTILSLLSSTRLCVVYG